MGSSPSSEKIVKKSASTKDKSKNTHAKKGELDDLSDGEDDATDLSDNNDSDSDKGRSGDKYKDSARRSKKGRKEFDKEKREVLLRELKAIAQDTIKHPPDRVPNSESYRTSYAEYQKVLNVLNKAVLIKVFDKELWALQEHTTNEAFSAEKSKEKTTREALIAEYKLKLCALVNCCNKMKSKIDDERMRLELEKLEDMKFLSKMHDRVENGEMTRALLVVHLERYSNEYRAKQNRFSDGSSVYSEGDRTTISRRNDYNSSKLGMSASDRRGGYLSPSAVGMNITDD